MKTSGFTWILAAAICLSTFCFASSAVGQEGESLGLGKIKRANYVAIDCSACPRSLAQAGKTARQELQSWNRFEIVEDPKKADLIFMFSANPYLGDYLTRKGPDTRPVRIETTILTVIDPHTGEELWSDYRRWGSWRVSGATKDLIAELRSETEVEARKWTVEEILRCSGASEYQVLASLSPDAAIAKPESGVRRSADDPDRFIVNSPAAPDFCRRGQLVIGSDGKIRGFEVVASASDSLDVADVLARADYFEFNSGKDPSTQKVFFTARTKDGKVSIQFDVRGRRTVLSRVRYLF